MTQAVALAQQASTGVSPGFRNRIINGAMVIDQRNAGASVTASTTGAWTYTLDRFAYLVSAASKFTIQQNASSVTPPVGFKNYLGVTSSAATSVGSGDYYMIKQAIEGFNTADLDWGTANAKTVTLSFWVRSSLTGTFGGALQNSSGNRSYPFTYTINSANTWEYETITIAGDTSGTWTGATNGTGINLDFGLGLGSTYSGTAGAWVGAEYYSSTGATNVVGTNGATFYITGVQLEVGSTATSFDYRPYGTELALCQRYYQTVDRVIGIGNFFSSSQIQTVITLPVFMRAAPTVNATAGLNFTDTGANYLASTVSFPSTLLTAQGGIVYFGAFSGITAYRPYWYQTANSSNNLITMSAEL